MLKAAIFCLALNIYYEANVEPLEGKYAVAQVTMNRVNNELYPNTVCKVVYEPYQFSWTLTPKSPPKGEGWKEANRVAKVVLNGWAPDITKGATHYHNNSVSPEWAKRKYKVKTIGKHVFYKFPDKSRG
jgi:N-acetylmuramoyl-L-alanine amidase